MSKELYFCSFRSSDWLVVEFPRASLGKLGKNNVTWHPREQKRGLTYQQLGSKLNKTSLTTMGSTGRPPSNLQNSPGSSP